MNYKMKEKELRNILKLIIDYRGKTPKKLGGVWEENGYPVLSAKNIKTGKIVRRDTIRYINHDVYKNWMKEEVCRGDILITSEAPVGEIYYWDSNDKVVLGQRLFGLRVKDEFDPKFIYYYMTSYMFQEELKSHVTGTTVLGLRQGELLNCKVKYPELKIQKKIGDILYSIDEKIRINNEINNNLWLHILLFTALFFLYLTLLIKV